MGRRRLGSGSFFAEEVEEIFSAVASRNGYQPCAFPRSRARGERIRWEWKRRPFIFRARQAHFALSSCVVVCFFCDGQVVDFASKV